MLKLPSQAALVLALACTTAAPALAHAPIDARIPAPGSTVHRVRTVQITFGDNMVTGLIEVRRGGSIQAPSVSGPANHNTLLRATFSKPLARGTYTVSWRALAKDGHHQHGTWTFTVR